MKASQAILAASLALTGTVDAFWRMPCRSQTGIARLDPLMDPGDISAHVHTITGGGGEYECCFSIMKSTDTSDLRFQLGCDLRDAHR
jgi:hypothetical protein